jgi:hypothetical protein
MSAVATRNAFPWPTVVAAFLAVAAAGAAAVAGFRTADAVRPAQPASPSGRVVTVGSARLVVPADWRSVSPSNTGVARLDAEHAAVFQPASRPWTRVVAAFDPTVEPSLIPDELQSAVLPARGVSRFTRVRGWPAWTYHVGRGARVTALATTAGVLGIACTGVGRLGTGSDCASDVDSVTVPGATALVPSRSLALEVHLPTVLDRLNRARSRHRATLKGARTNESQALAARQLGADHRAAAHSLRSLGGPAAVPLMRDLTDVADAYDTLARAADDASPGEFTLAATGIRHAEVVLAGGVAAVSRPETAEVTARVTTLRQDRDGSAPSGVPPILFALLTALAMIAGATAGNSDGAWRLSRRLFPPGDDAYFAPRPGLHDRRSRTTTPARARRLLRRGARGPRNAKLRRIRAFAPSRRPDSNRRPFDYEAAHTVHRPVESYEVAANETVLRSDMTPMYPSKPPFRTQ